MVLLYFTGIVVGVLAALLLKSTVFKGEAVPFVMELPNYRLPGLKNVAQLLWEKARDFLQKAFTVIFAATIVIWFLQNFDLQLRLTADPQASILARIAGDIAPLFGPLGFADWRISTALITGFMAKESVVSSLLILFGSDGCPDRSPHPGAGRTPAGVLPAVHPLHRGGGLGQAGAWRQVGHHHGGEPVRRGMAVRPAGASGRRGGVLRKMI